MSNGRATNLIWIVATLGGAAGASCGVLAVDAALRDAPAPARLGAGFAVATICFFVITAVLFKLVAKETRSLVSRLTPDAVNGPLAQTRTGFPSNGFIEPITDLARSWSAAREGLTASIQEVRIRHKVSEAERQHVEAILHSLRDAVLVTDSFDELSMANGPAADLLKFDLKSAQHASIDAILADETVRKLIKEVRSSAVHGKERRIEHVIHDDQGATHSYDVTVACLPDAGADGFSPGGGGNGGGGGGGGGGVVTIMRDVTRDKEISQMKNDFVSQASHELRTPLASIRAYVEMLTEGEATDEESRQEFYGIIKTETDRVARMVDNMLNISRIEAGIVKAEYTDVDFVSVSKEVVEMMAVQAQEKSIKLAVKNGPLVYNASADRDMMTQVIMNLLSNGIKYTPEGGRVTVTIDNDDASRSVMVTIADTGLGIPPDSLAKVFDKFFRIENYKRVAKGTGLGLNLVRHIVETVHSGHVGVTSEVGMGSKFWFTIPYEQDDGNT